VVTSIAASGVSALSATSSRAAVDDAAYLTDYLNRAGASARISGSYVLDRPIELPHSLRSLELRSTARLAVRGNQTALIRAGSTVFREHLPAAIVAGSDAIATNRPSLYSVGEYLLLSGANTVSGSADRYGYLRRVVAIEPASVRVDSPIPRVIDQMPRSSKVALAPSLKIYGSGQIYNLDPATGMSALVNVVATDNFQIHGVDIHDNGTTAINVANCLNGLIDCTVHDLLDDGQTYFGYGVSASGATRGLVVKGVISRVRHAVTTNPGPLITNVGRVGEPEDCTFAPAAVDCSDKSVDTHRLGWNTTIIPNVVRGRGGVQVRADNTHVVGGSIVGSAGPGISISSVVQVPAQIRDVAISDLQASGTAILSSGPSRSENVTIRNSYGPNIVLSSYCVVRGGSISAGNAIGVKFVGSHNRVSEIQLGESVTTPYVESADSIDNQFSTAPPTDIELLPPPICTQDPGISGVAQVGQQLACGYGVWNQSNLRLSWTWTRDGLPIPGASERTYPRYDVTAADLGRRIGAVVRAYKTGFETGIVQTTETEAVAPAPALVPTAAPSLSGTPSVGSYVTVNKGTWTPSAQSITVEWLLNGAIVAGLTTNSYRVRSSDVGSTIAVRVTAKRSGYLDGVYTTAEVTMIA
jgi:hypothetical protein